MAEQGLGVAVDQVAQPGHGLPGLMQLARIDPGRTAGDLDDGPAQRASRRDGGAQAERAFAADGGGFDRLAAAHQRHQ